MYEFSGQPLTPNLNQKLRIFSGGKYGEIEKTKNGGTWKPNAVMEGDIFFLSSHVANSYI